MVVFFSFKIMAFLFKYGFSLKEMIMAKFLNNG